MGRIRRILPIVVVHERIFRFGRLAKTLTTEFTRGLVRLKIRPDFEPLEIYPFQLLTVEELERLQPNIQERDFDRRGRGKERRFSLSIWGYSIPRVPTKG